MKRTFTLALLSSLLLQGCVWAPGQYLHRDELKNSGTVEGAKVELIPITSSYLLSHDASKPQASTNLDELLKYRPEAYRVGKADLLYITVWDHPELTAPSGAQQQIDANGRLVRPDGTIFYPYVGTVNAAGRTLEEIRKTISTRLATFIDNPQVDVSVLRFGSQKVTLSGAFTKGDSIPLTTVPITLPEALGQAGVDTDSADLSGLTLVRDGKEYQIDTDTLNRKNSKLYGIYLKDGDSIHLPYNDNRKVFVLGEVNNPLATSFKTTSLSLMDALGQAGGLSQETADADEVYVIRGAADFQAPGAKAQVFHLSASSPAAFVLAQHFALQPQDVVYVGPAGITRWNRFISQLLGSSNVISSAANANSGFSN
ncbi:polysaccharide export outer membrane protein [Pseudomonas duriflava]|uniref:Polysaccharide export outer membrane protein n=1 Tax=Pseudomonas duriflava TaxID=459528 RepID=A0A562QIJ0_9PSED|nr:polysaccharide biosynthesis/export family protein [Pseudomonas duriflava]TWI56588.1 polysaccharide export outer membrane protein [Pseudomonas duriflava]